MANRSRRSGDALAPSTSARYAADEPVRAMGIIGTWERIALLAFR